MYIFFSILKVNKLKLIFCALSILCCQVSSVHPDAPVDTNQSPLYVLNLPLENTRIPLTPHIVELLHGEVSRFQDI